MALASESVCNTLGLKVIDDAATGLLPRRSSSSANMACMGLPRCTQWRSQSSKPNRPPLAALACGVVLAFPSVVSSLCKLNRYRIYKVTSSAGSARNQMIRAWLFARYGIIGLALDDVPGVRA